MARLEVLRHVSLTLTHNDHKGSYETVEEHLLNADEDDCWVSDEQRTKAIATDSVWRLQWYPDTPVGFCVLLAADLEVLLEAVALHTRDYQNILHEKCS